jgi:hypothetical protein
LGADLTTTRATGRVVPVDTTQPGPTLVTSVTPWEGSVGAAPVAEAVPGADGTAPMAVARVASARACPVMDRGSLSRALRAAIGVKRADSEATAAASACTA